MSILNFSGRTSIKDYWLGLVYWYVVPPLFVALVALLLLGINFLAVLLIFFTPLPWFYFLVISVARLAVTARRCNDAGVSPLFCLLTLVPVLQFFPAIVIGLLPSKKNSTYIEIEDLKLNALEVETVQTVFAKAIPIVEPEVYSDENISFVLKLLGICGLLLFFYAIYLNYLNYADTRYQQIKLYETYKIISEQNFIIRWAFEGIVGASIILLGLLGALFIPLFDCSLVGLAALSKVSHKDFLNPFHAISLNSFENYPSELIKALYSYSNIISDGTFCIVMCIGILLTAKIFHFKSHSTRLELILIDVSIVFGVYLNFNLISLFLVNYLNNSYAVQSDGYKTAFAFLFCIAYTAFDFIFFWIQCAFLIISLFWDGFSWLNSISFVVDYKKMHQNFLFISDGSIIWLIWFVLTPFKIYYDRTRKMSVSAA